MSSVPIDADRHAAHLPKPRRDHVFRSRTPLTHNVFCLKVQKKKGRKKGGRVGFYASK